MKPVILPPLERLQALLHYDPATGALTWIDHPDPRTRSRLVGKRAGGVCGRGYRYVRIDGRKLLAHRVAFKMATGQEPPPEVDHQDCDRDNASEQNLRAATRSQNNGNKRSTGQYPKGVSRELNRYVARIWNGTRSARLGVFDTPEEAHEAYMSAARERWGSFARGS